MPNISKENLGTEHLLVLYAVDKAPDGIPTKVHYQKIMYMVLKALGNDPRDAGYVPHHFGPYSPVVDDWRNVLIESGYLDKNTKERIRISPSVKSDVDRLSLTNPLDEAKISGIVLFFSDLTHDELILYVYTEDIANNEGMTCNSDIIEDIFDRRVAIARNMVRKEKVTIEKGAELADMDLVSFSKLMKAES